MPAHKTQYMERADITYAPAEATDTLIRLDAKPSERDGVKFEIDVQKNPRNVDGYRSKLLKDLLALRAAGCVVNFIYTQAAIKEALAGKIELPGIEPLTTGGSSKASKSEKATG